MSNESTKADLKFDARGKDGVNGFRNDLKKISDEIRHFTSVRLEAHRVLLVDDSADNQKLFQRILTSAGARVDLASNGLEAIERVELCAGEPYSAIIMDIRMPVLDGYEATRRIRQLGFSGPVIALTAHNTPGEEMRCRAAGCSHFYLKPIDRLGLLKAVKFAASVESSSSDMN